MQSENFDNKLRQAAEQHHPKYDETAWKKMEKLLNRELPQKEDRRRRFIFLLLFVLLLGGGGWLFFDKPWRQDSLTETTGSRGGSHEKSIPGDIPQTTGNTENTATQNSIQDRQPGSGEIKKAEIPADIYGPGAGQLRKPTERNESNFEITVDGGGARAGNGHRTQPAKRKETAKSGNNLEVEVISGNIAQNGRPKKNMVSPGEEKMEIVSSGGITKRADAPSGKAGTGDSSLNNSGNKENATNKDNAAIPPDTTETAATNSEPAKKENKSMQPDTATGKAVAKQSPVKKKNALSFSVSAGPDLSSVGFDNPGKVKVVTGAGIGYTIREKWTIRTGFYSANKVYDAKPADYKPATPLPLPDYLKDISAECRVYEIPLTIAYHFGRSPKQGTFVSAGLSSFIMKKESYVYNYVYPGGGTFTYTHKEENKFRHYFSVLSLSGGYQRRINKTFSVVVEPYLKLPLAGVGYGKVKLNNAGILFSLNVHPFQFGK